MPNTSVPAAAEGLPTEAIVQMRIRELMKEIALLLDKTTPAASSFVTVHAASSGRASLIGFDLDIDEVPLSAMLIRSEDKLGDATAFIDLIVYAMEGMSPAREINCLQYGIMQVRKSIHEAHVNIELARNQI